MFLICACFAEDLPRQGGEPLLRHVRFGGDGGDKPRGELDVCRLMRLPAAAQMEAQFVEKLRLLAHEMMPRLLQIRKGAATMKTSMQGRGEYGLKAEEPGACRAGFRSTLALLSHQPHLRSPFVAVLLAKT